MIQRVRLHNVKKGQRVILVKQLPVGRGFGNNNPIKEEARGDITSEGFVGGMLKVKFYTYITGTENVQFNELSAADYLQTDIL